METTSQRMQRSRLLRAGNSWRRPRRKKSVRSFPQKFSGPETMETTALATLLRRPLGQLQEVPAAESADPGQIVLATASSKKIVRNFPQKISGPENHGNHSTGNVATKAIQAAAGSFCTGVGCSGQKGLTIIVHPACPEKSGPRRKSAFNTDKNGPHFGWQFPGGFSACFCTLDTRSG